MDKHYCRVCGFYNEDLPWGQDGQSPTYYICPCCGVEFGNEDYSLDSIRKFRAQWMKREMMWFEPNEKPIDWNFEKQLKNVPREYL